MYYIIVNLDDHDLVFKNYTFEPGEEQQVSESVVNNNWSLFTGLVEDGLITMTAVGSAPEEDADIDVGAEVSRLEIAFEEGHSDPIGVKHNRGKIPIVQVIDSDYGVVLPDENEEGGYYEAPDYTVSIVHPDENTTNIYTDATSGTIILIF